MKLRHLLATTLLAAWVATLSLQADVRLPNVIGSHMVLQRGMPLNIWGWADPDEKVSVELAGRTASVRANQHGEWMATLPALEAGGPHALKVVGKNTVTLSDILIGEVWLGSGQSNMQWSVEQSANPQQEIAAANHPRIRLFLVPNVLSGIPNRDVAASWKACSPASVRRFSAVLYYFGRHLHKKLDVPVGLIASAWGGSRIEPWTPPSGFAGVKALDGLAQSVRSTQVDYLKKLQEQVDALTPARPDLKAWLKRAIPAAEAGALVPPVPEERFNYPPHPLAGWPTATSMFNAMIHPVVPFAMRGAIWYQGESNLDDGMLYYHKKKALVEGWRKVWNNDALSFYWAQLAPFNYGGDPGRLARIWEAQYVATSIPRTGMAVITDIGNLRDIHPRNKQDVGKRLALVALKKDYGKDVIYSGPTYRSIKIEGNAIRVSFDHVGSGLESRDGKPLNWFEIAGEGDFVPAKAVIDGNTVVVSSARVTQPAAVRFAWSQLAEPNLRNKEGLPACSFRTTSTAPTIRGKRLFVSSTTVEIACAESNGVIRYTIDGSTPTAQSAVYSAPIKLVKSTTVRAKFFRKGGPASVVTGQEFQQVQPRRFQGLSLVPGVRYDYYEGNWAALPDFSKLTPKKSGMVDDLGIEARRRGDGFAFRFTGYLEIKKPGTYTFETDSDDGSKLYVDDKEIVNNDGIHPVLTRKGSVDLKPGFHKIVVTFFEGGGGEALRVRYSGPDARGAIPLWGAEPEPKFYDPVEKNIEGWTIAVDPQLMAKENEEVAKKAFKALANHLQRVTYIVPKDRLAKLQKLRIWLDLNHKLGNMQYHPARKWLVDHGYDPRLVKHVHIPRAKALYSPHMWAKHPYVVLHELAHAYHDQMLGFNEPSIVAAFKAAKEKGIYDQVLLYTGKKVRHYALSNHKEYFAESTEAYFGVNDFYPFVRAELKEHDPKMFELMEKFWGKLR